MAFTAQHPASGSLGAADLSGAGTAFGTVDPARPGGDGAGGRAKDAGATATSGADLGARTIREEIDAMRVLGIDPDPAPGGAARAGTRHSVALLLNGLVCAIGSVRRLCLLRLGVLQGVGPRRVHHTVH